MAEAVTPAERSTSIAAAAFRPCPYQDDGSLAIQRRELAGELERVIGTPSRYVIKHVFRPEHLEEPVASTSTSRLSLIAGRYVGKDDPIMIVRC